MPSVAAQSELRVAVVTPDELRAAWAWWRSTLSKRGVLPADAECLYDVKKFAGPSGPPDFLVLKAGQVETTHVARLNLASRSLSARILNRMANGGAPAVVSVASPLDKDLRDVVEDEERFRDGLSEHIAFWARQADAAANLPISFAMAKPNLQPEDKGHDGLIIVSGSSPLVELQSVKNSIRSPRFLVGSGKFRAGGEPKKGAMDDIQRLRKVNAGLSRLEEMVSEIVDVLNLPLDDSARLSLAKNFATNIVAVADAVHDKPALFEGYRHVGGEPADRIGTLIGARTWKATAEVVRNETISILRSRGL